MEQILKSWYWVMCLEREYLIKQCYEWQTNKMSVRSWTMELEEELCNNGLAFVWRKQEDCNKTEIKIVKDR